MKLRLAILFCSVGLLTATAATDFNNLSNNAIWIRLSSSWDAAPFALYGDYMDGMLINMNPGATLHPRSVASGGQGLDGFLKIEIPIRGIPSLGYRTNGYQHIGFIHITDPSSNIVATNLPVIFQAPTNLWNNSAFAASTGWAHTSHVEWVSLGMQPDEASDGNPLTVGIANTVSTNVANTWGYAWNDWFNVLEPAWATDYAGPQRVWSTDAGHPKAAGHFNMTVAALKGIGVDTNIWSASAHWDASNVSTNHCVLISPTKTGNTLSFTLHLDRMAFGWDILDGTSTNDASAGILVKPEDGNSFRELFTISDAPDGNYLFTVDSDSFLVTGAQLRAGYNFFTNYSTAIWRQKEAVLGDLRDRRGVGRVTLNATHDANGSGAHNLKDEINLYSVANGAFPGSQGDALIAATDTVETDLFSLDDYAHADTQQTNHTVSLTFIVPRFAPFHR